MASRYYRIVSEYPLAKPKLTIPDLPPANPGFTTKYTELTRSKARAARWMRSLKRAGGFGKHRLQEMTLDPGLVVRTERGTFVTKEPRPARE